MAGINIEDYEEYGEPRPPSGRRKRAKEVEESNETLTPDQRIERHFFKLDPNWKNLSDDELVALHPVYFNWVSRSLAVPDDLFREEDLEVKEGKMSTKVIHLPTTLYGLDIMKGNESKRLINAKDKAFMYVDSHFKIWQKTSYDFRKKYLKAESPLKIIN